MLHDDYTVSIAEIRSYQHRQNFNKIIWSYLLLILVGILFIVFSIFDGNKTIIAGHSTKILGFINIFVGVVFSEIWFLAKKFVFINRLGTKFCGFMTYFSFFYYLCEDGYFLIFSEQLRFFGFSFFALIGLVFIALFDMLPLMVVSISLGLTTLFGIIGFAQDLFSFDMCFIAILYLFVIVLLAYVLDRFSCDNLRNLFRLMHHNEAMQKSIEEKEWLLQNLHHETVMGLANLIECRSGETGFHVKHTQYYMECLVRELQLRGLYADILTNDYANLCINAACLHDIGKISVPDSILNAPRKLSTEEFEIMKMHTTAGAAAIDNVLGGVENSEYLQVAKQVALSHHERWDGTGYPNKISGDSIPLCARLMSVVDVYDALISERCYKKAIPKSEALQIMNEGAGTQFDPVLVSVFSDVLCSLS